MDLSAKLNTVWASSGIGLMEELQKLIFPGGISYDHKAEKGGLPPRPGRPTSVIPDGGVKPKQVLGAIAQSAIPLAIQTKNAPLTGSTCLC